MIFKFIPYFTDTFKIKNIQKNNSKFYKWIWASPKFSFWGWQKMTVSFFANISSIATDTNLKKKTNTFKRHINILCIPIFMQWWLSILYIKCWTMDTNSCKKQQHNDTNRQKIECVKSQHVMFLTSEPLFHG